MRTYSNTAELLFDFAKQITTKKKNTHPDTIPVSCRKKHVKYFLGFNRSNNGNHELLYVVLP